MVALVGLIALARLKRRGLAVLSCSLLALAMVGGATAVVMLDVSVVVLAASMLAMVGLFAQMAAANLLADANHPWILNAERELRALPPQRRRRYLLVRLALGLGMSTLSLIATLVSYLYVGSSIYTVWWGAFGAGLLIAATPLIAGLRARSRAA